jgi:predicted MPP superfamily phosphohydrolase
LGHAHVGQFIIPFAGGLYAPGQGGQGFFPRYYKGQYTENGVNLVVSRGLGNSVIPVRIFNRPEIISISLKPTTL